MKRIIPVAFLALVVLSLSCREYFQVVSEKWSMEGLQRGPKILKSYDTVFIGWMDLQLGGADWKSMRYESEKDWIGFVENLNNYFIPSQFPAWLPGKKIIKAKTKDEAPPPNAQLYIKFNRAIHHVAVAKGDIPLLHKSFFGWEVLEVDMSFTDLKTGKELCKFDVVVTSKDSDPLAYRFESRVQNRVDNLAAFLQKYL